MSDCIFCDIARGKFNTEFVYEDEYTAVFKDINPIAPLHLLVVPKKHVKSLGELEDKNIMAALFNAVKNSCEKIGIKEYRTVINTGKSAGQEVLHLHLHVISGRDFGWPPG